jgi:hypothetical protein
MYAIAIVFESRFPVKDVPVWHQQSKAYLPGDSGLALMVAIGICLRPYSKADWISDPWFLVSCYTIGWVIYYLARKFLYTSSHYGRIAWRSPSKQYHDVVMFLIFSATAIYVCLPAYFLSPWRGFISVKALGLFGLLIWIGGNIYDFTHDEVPNNKQHPVTYYRNIFKTIQIQMKK